MTQKWIDYISTSVVLLPHRFFNSHHYLKIVVPEFSTANTYSKTPLMHAYNNPNLQRPPNTAFNIQ